MNIKEFLQEEGKSIRPQLQLKVSARTPKKVA